MAGCFIYSVMFHMLHITLNHSILKIYLLSLFTTLLFHTDFFNPSEVEDSQVGKLIKATPLPPSSFAYARSTAGKKVAKK